MKTLLKLTFLLFFSITNAQFAETALPDEKVKTIGGFSNLGMSHAVLRYEIIDDIKVYSLKYGLTQDVSHILQFNETGSDLEALYDLINTFFIKENKKKDVYKKAFKLGDVDVICRSSHNIPYQVSFKTDQGQFRMSERQFNKLFGKR
ncbi:hypothetical protein [Oceanihabitans sediminis]|uniref:hypothetical protein n=1 Tax=Oceanihabitans sediminis TaxID=1812012 RepID=UPI003A925F5F